MRGLLYASVCASALFVLAPAVAHSQEKPASPMQASIPEETSDPSGQVDRADRQDMAEGGDVVVTATRREERIQDVPISVTAFQQGELTRKGIVGFEGVARETPGVVLNRPTQNFNNFTVRGIATNGYGANLQSTVAVYLDELPVSTIGNTTVIDPNLFDVERVEFLRGPQGTLFGSGSLSGAMRILTKSPDLSHFDRSALVDIGLTGSDSLRQRYNVMVNVPIVDDKLAIRGVGFYRHEEGYLDNVGTGVHNSNTLVDYGGRMIALWKPNDRLSVRLLGSYENSDPKDSSLTSPSLGREKRISDQPDRFTGKQTILNATIDYDLGFAKFTSSSTYSDFDQRFWADLANTFGGAIAFGLDANAYDKVFVEEARLASAFDGPLQFVIGGFYLNRRRDVDYFYRSSLPFLEAAGITGLPDQYYQKQYTHQKSTELAGFGELTYRFSDRFWLTGGVRYGEITAQGFTEEGGYSSDYFVAALTGRRGPLTLVPYEAVTGVKAQGSKPSWKASASFRPTDAITTYATFATGYRGPVVNAFAGRSSTVNPNDIVIPYGASSDDLKSYEVGAKGRWLDGRVTINAAAYWIDWSNIQVQANRISDSVQFATNVGAARSRGFEVEMAIIPATGFSIGLNAAYNDAKITELTPEEAAISGAVLGHRLSAPRLQGSTYASYAFDLGRDTTGNLAVNAQYVGSYNSSFPNVAGSPGQRLPTFGETDEYVNVNLTAGVSRGSWTGQLYVENVTDNHSVTYIHPEAFFASRFGTLRPRTVGLRIGYGI
jgi:outer membrane receptor protein involved in Fe transport